MNHIVKAGPSVILLVYVAKLIAFGASMPDALIVAVLCSLSGLNHLINHIKFKSKTQETLLAFAEELKTHKNALAEQDYKVKEAISYVSNMKLQTQSFRAK